jgi:hypothetical protein
MATSPDANHSGGSNAQPARSVLHLEMESDERRLLSLFAASFLKWIKDEAASSFARDIGTPASISFDESARDARRAMLHLTVAWAGPSADALAPRAGAIGATPPQDPDALAPLEMPASSLFAYQSETPVFERAAATADLTMMMAAVFEQSERLGRSTHSRRVWIPAPLDAAAERGGQVLARWADAATGSTAVVLHRSRTGGREALAHARSLVQSLRARPAAGIKPVSWAAAGLVAASVIYVGWPAAAPARPVAPGLVAAATPQASRPAATTAPQAEKSPAALVADARSPEAASHPTSGVAQGAPAIPPAPTSPTQMTANTVRVNPTAHERGYFGSLMVTSDPEGADVSVDGVPQGRTPLAIAKLNIGSRVVRVELPGHQRWSWAVSVVANRRTPIAVRLLPETHANAVPSATPTVDSVDSALERTKMF